MVHSKHSHFTMEEWGHKKEGYVQKWDQNPERQIFYLIAPYLTFGACGIGSEPSQVSLEITTLHAQTWPLSSCCTDLTQQMSHISSVLIYPLQLSLLSVSSSFCHSSLKRFTPCYTFLGLSGISPKILVGASMTLVYCMPTKQVPCE